MKKFLIMVAGLLVLTALLAGCAGNGPVQPSKAPAGETQTPADGPVAEADVAYAEPMVDNMLAGIKDRDYAVLSRDFSDIMKSSMTEDAMGQLADILSKIGEYQSRTFAQAANMTQGGKTYTVVIYTAKYSDEPGDVLMTLYFTEDKKIEGLNFNSPKLRQQ